MTIWDCIIRHFKKTERWGKPDKMCGYTLLSMAAIRTCIDSPIIPICGYEYRPEGYHPKGLADDFLCPELSDWEAYSKLTKALKDLQLDNFVGFGFYPFAKYKKKLKCSFHFDCRGFKARWVALETHRDKNGKILEHIYGYTDNEIKAGIEILKQREGK